MSCRKGLHGLQSGLEKLTAAGVEVAAVSADTPEVSRTHATEESYGFPLLADPGRTAIRAYGLIHEDVADFGDVARPAEFLIDEHGRVSRRWMTGTLAVRLKPDQVLEALAGPRG